jgi:methyl coenzyme M reductase subunit D
MSSAWGKSFGISWGSSWGAIEAKRIQGYGNSPEERTKHPQPVSGIFSEKLLTAELEAKLFESETELQQVIQAIVPPTPLPVSAPSGVIQDAPETVLPDRAIDLQKVIATLKAQIAATLKAEADRKRKIRQARDNKDLAEFMMAFSIIVTGKGMYGQPMGNAPQRGDT